MAKIRNLILLVSLGGLCAQAKEIPLLFEPVPKPLPSTLSVEWLDAQERVLESRVVNVSESRLRTQGVPPHAVSLRVADPSWVSHPRPIQLAARIGLPVVVPAYLTVPVHAGQHATLFLGRRLEKFGLTVESRDLSGVPGEDHIRIPLFPETYWFVLDLGRDRGLATQSGVAMAAGQQHTLPAPADGGRHVVLRAAARGPNTPLPGAGITALMSANDLDRVIAAALGTRAGKSGTDGLLDVGVIQEDIKTFAVGAPERRMARVSLGAPEPGQNLPITVALPFPQAIKLQVDIDARREVRESAFEVTLERDATVDEAVATRTPLGEPRWVPARTVARRPGDFVLLERVTPGRYRLRLVYNGATVWQDQVLSSFKAEDPDVVEAAAHVVEWSVAGTTVLADDSPVSANVGLTTVQAGLLRLGSTTSDVNGRFEVQTLAPGDQRVNLLAESAHPRGSGIWEGVLTTGAAPNEPIRVVLKTAGLRAITTDYRNGMPIQGCTVEAGSVGAEKALHQSATTDASGVVEFLGVEKGTVSLSAKCSGYSAGSAPIQVQVGDGSVPDVEISMTPSGAVALRVVAGGMPVSGALVQQVQVTAGMPREAGLYLPAREVGVTDAAGELVIPADSNNGQVVFVVARGFGLGAAKLPLTCANESTPCQAMVELSGPRFGERLGISNSDGKWLNPAWCGFFLDGDPIPRSVLSALLRANGRSPDSTVVDEDGHKWSTVPELLPTGVHDVLYLLRAKGMPVGMFLGRIALPSSEPIALKAAIPTPDIPQPQ